MALSGSPVAPAVPVLASSLLPSDAKRQGQEPQAKDQIQFTERGWSLENDLRRGFAREKDAVFGLGRVVGVSGLRKSDGNGGHDSSGEGDISVDELALHLLRTHLLGDGSTAIPSTAAPSTAPSTSHPKAFILTASNSSALSPDQLFAHIRPHINLESAGRGEEEENMALAILDRVQILRVFDYPGLLDAVSEVSDTLYRIKQDDQRAATRYKHTRTVPGTPDEIDEDDEDNEEKRADGSFETAVDEGAEPILLLIEGLDMLTDSVIRSSSPMKGNALLTPLLQTLTRLSRAYASILGILLVNTVGISVARPAMESGHAAQPSAQAQRQGHTHAYPPMQTQTQTQAQAQRPLQRRRPSPPSAFLQNRIHPSSFLGSALWKTLDHGIDTHLLVSRIHGSASDDAEDGHDGKGTVRIVEVTKDRDGVGLGKWSVWKEFL